MSSIAERMRASAGKLTAVEVAGLRSLHDLAASIDVLVSGAITRDANGTAIGASLLWPDGATGVYAATTVSTTFPGAVDAYTVTHVLAGVSRIFAQPAVTRDANGAVINRPPIVES